jgi:hypothetical protein
MMFTLSAGNNCILLNLCHGPKSVLYPDEVNATTYIVVEVVGCFDFDFINLDPLK